MADVRLEVLQDAVNDVYQPHDYPALRWQTRTWRETVPLRGVRLLDVTPVFTNTVAKYIPLLAAGADLTVSLSPLLPHDPAVVRLLESAGISVTSDSGTYDVVMDCAGVQADSVATAGYVELTKTGQAVYEMCPKPVFLVDDSRLKLIETMLGTGDGFVRALAHFGHHDLSGRSIVIFGAGKVGRGAALCAREAGAEVTLIDPAPEGHPPVIDSAWCVVTATGERAALDPLVDRLRAGDAILANLGAEDEYGPRMPAQRVLNNKVPVNFALPEPTRLRFLDPTLALVNACALALVTGEHPASLNPIPRDIEGQILDVVREHGDVDLTGIEQELQ